MIESGVWKIVLTPGRIVDGEYQMWLPTSDVIKYGDSVFTAEQYVDIDDSIYGVACCYRGGI